MNLYTLEVFIISGPMTEEFLKNNSVISRTIEIQGIHTLKDLHLAIFDAFDREDEHMYEFQIGGKGPNDPKTDRYSTPDPFGISEDAPQLSGDPASTAIDSLGLKTEDTFGYWFDFGDDWWHQINVISIKDRSPSKAHPRVIKRIGKSPPQYLD